MSWPGGRPPFLSHQPCVTRVPTLPPPFPALQPPPLRPVKVSSAQRIANPFWLNGFDLPFQTFDFRSENIYLAVSSSRLLPAGDQANENETASRRWGESKSLPKRATVKSQRSHTNSLKESGPQVTQRKAECGLLPQGTGWWQELSRPGGLVSLEASFSSLPRLCSDSYPTGPFLGDN